MKAIRSRVLRAGIAGVLLSGCPAVSYAATPYASWFGGAAHPVLEYTHALAVLGTGILAAVLGGRARWTLPVIMALLMAVGLVLGSQGAATPPPGTLLLTVGLSIVLLILANVDWPFAVIGSFAGAFGLFHGVSDGFLMKVGEADVAYCVGFAGANVVTLVAGLGIGEWLHRRYAHPTAGRPHGWRNLLHGPGVWS